MRPQVSQERALALARQQWGFEHVDTATQLAGYDDTNLRITGPSGASFVFKVHNEGDSAPEEQYAEAQNALLGYLAAAGIPVPAPLPLVNADIGEGASSRDCDGYTLRITAEDGRQHAARMLTWLPGSLLVDVPQSAELYCQLGALLAQVNRVLQGWDWQATGVLRREHAWNLMHLAATWQRIRADLLQLPGLDVPLLDQVVSHLQAVTSAAGSSLRQCIIHSDANERNVLVDEAAAAAAAAAAPAAAVEGPQGQSPAGGSTAASSGSSSMISGLIDWGDASWQWLAAEPAIAMVYMMLLDANIDDPLPAAAALLQGFERQQPLLPAERQLLRTLAMGRLAQSLSLGAHSALQQPDNTAYLLGTQRNGWRLLRTLWGMSDQHFLEAMGC